MLNKDFQNLHVDDRAYWLVGNMLCSALDDDPPKLFCDEGDIVLVKTGDVYAVIYQFYDVDAGDFKLKTIGFESLKKIYDYLIHKCGSWKLSDERD